MARKAKKPKKVKKPIKGKQLLRMFSVSSAPPVPPDQRPFHLVFTTSEDTASTRKRRFFTSLQIALRLLTADDMDKIEPILVNRIGAGFVKDRGAAEGYSF